MMVENRFNAISLWTMHPFTYMIRPKNFPEASKWSDAEFAEWQHLYREIFRMAKERGLDTYVVFWSIFVSEEFAKAHGVATAEFLSALLRERRHLRGHETLPARKRDADARGVPGPRRHRRLARRRHGRHDAARAPAVRRRGVRRGRAGSETRSTGETHPSRAVLVGTDLGPRRQRRRRADHARGDGETRQQVRGTDLGGDEVQLVARPFDAEAGEGARRQARRYLLQATADQLQDRLAGAQRGLLRAALGRAGLHPPAHRTSMAGRNTSAATSSAPRPTSRRSTTSRLDGQHVALEVRLRAPVAVLQALGPAALRPDDTRLGVPGRIHASLRPKAGAAAARPTRSLRTRSCASRRSTTHAGTSRCTARGSSRCRARTRNTSASTRSSISRRWIRTTSRSPTT